MVDFSRSPAPTRRTRSPPRLDRAAACRSSLFASRRSQLITKSAKITKDTKTKTTFERRDRRARRGERATGPAKRASPTETAARAELSAQILEIVNRSRGRPPPIQQSASFLSVEPLRLMAVCLEDGGLPCLPDRTDALRQPRCRTRRGRAAARGHAARAAACLSTAASFKPTGTSSALFVLVLPAVSIGAPRLVFRPGRHLDILPLKRYQLADAAARRNGRDNQAAKMWPGVIQEALLLARPPSVALVGEAAITRLLVREFCNTWPPRLNGVLSM